MYKHVLAEVRRRLPETVAFNFYSDRQAPWLLAHLMQEDAAPVRQLRAGPAAKLLDRPSLRPLLARCGGVLRRADVMALAYAEHFEAFDTGPAGAAALEAAWALPWHDFELSFTDWGVGPDWRYAQVSRAGGSLVVQLGFPSDHAALMGRYLPEDARAKFEESFHPVRTAGRPTLAWARLDVDLDRGEALIEEVQCDWLRMVEDEVAWLASSEAKSRDLRVHQAYKSALFAAYAKLWPQAMLLAALMVAVEHLGLRRVWMHQPEAGAILKGIQGITPPVSLYTKLPKSFCFAPVREVPALLQPGPWTKRPRFARDRMKAVQRIADAGRPTFWRLDL